MSKTVLTLFGEEVVPEKAKPEPKKPAAKKAALKEDAIEEEEPVAAKEKIAKPKAEKVPKKEKELTRADALSTFGGEKQYYTIGEVAALFSVRTSNIRFWTKEFEMKVRTTRKGDRLYTPEQVREINTIYHLVKEKGFTITGAKAKLKTSKKTTIESVDLKKSLTHLRTKLLQIRNKLS